MKLKGMRLGLALTLLFILQLTTTITPVSSTRRELNFLNVSLLDVNKYQSNAKNENEQPNKTGHPSSGGSRGGGGGPILPATQGPCVSMCPPTVSIGWIDRYPFVSLRKRHNNTRSRVNSTKPGSRSAHVTGIFPSVLDAVIRICCSKMRTCGMGTQLNYTVEPAEGLREMEIGMVDKKYDFILPVHSEKSSYASYNYVHVVNSPGLILITNKQHRNQAKRERMVQNLKNTWPIVVVTLLLTGMAGITVWALDSCWNPVEFPPSFGRGALEGCWWAFVTMTTVGYGDRAPKSCFARLFGVLWITVGLVICSFMTASLTSALTALSVKESDSDIFGKKIGVVDDFGYEKAQELGANIFHYRGMEKAFDGLVHENEVEGLLFEMMTGKAFMSMENRHESAEISHVIHSQYSLGVTLNSQGIRPDNKGMWNLQSCLRLALKYRSMDVIKIAEHYLKKDETERNANKVSSGLIQVIDPDSDNVRSLLLLLSLTVGLMCIVGMLFEALRRVIAQRHKTKEPCCVKENSNGTEMMGRMQRLEHAISEFKADLTQIIIAPPAYDECKLKTCREVGLQVP